MASQITMVVMVVMVVVQGGVDGAAARRLPKWLVPCNVKDPQFSACAVRHGQDALPFLCKGDRKLRLPSLEPLEITALRVGKEANKFGLDFSATDIKTFGFNETKLLDYTTDPDAGMTRLTFFIPKMTIKANYTVSGKVLLLPISGSGPCTGVLENLTVTMSAQFGLEERDNGRHYMVFTDKSLDFNLTRAHFDLKNLFNGNKLLGESMNNVLNENWEEVLQGVTPAIMAAVQNITLDIFTTLAGLVAMEDGAPPAGAATPGAA